MRFLFNFILFVAVAVGVGFIVYDNRLPSTDVVAREDLIVQMHAKPKLPASEITKIVGDAGAVDVNCFVWGPFDEKELVGIQPILNESNLMAYAQIVDRYLPDRWIVYLGRFNNDKAVRAFMKQFRQQGFSSVRPILRGDLAFGVEIAAFDSQAQAQAYLDSSKAPDVEGLSVTNRLGEPSDEVDIVFQDIDDSARERLFREWKRRPAKELKNCGFFRN